MDRFQRTSFTAIGTKWSIDVPASLPPGDWSRLLGNIQARIEQFDNHYSRFKSDSWVTESSKSAGKYPLPGGGYELLRFYKDLYAATDGRVTPLIGQTMSDAGYDADYSLKSKRLSAPPPWKDVIEFDHSWLSLKAPALLDFGAAGKGYLVDIVSSLMAEANIKDYVIDASGDILHRSSDYQSVRVGLENPINTKQAIGVVELNNKSLCASAGSRRKWGKYNHIIDPKNLESPSEIIATWVIADDTMTADGLATALFFSRPKQLAMYNFAYAVLHQDMSIEYSPSFPAEVL